MARKIPNIKEPLEFKINPDQMKEIDILRQKTFEIYNFNRAMMIMLVKEMAANRWQFEDSDPLKVEFDPQSLMVKVSVDERAESVA
jgi:hypothetical protein